jgi:hypothetical protein
MFVICTPNSIRRREWTRQDREEADTGIEEGPEKKSLILRGAGVGTLLVVNEIVLAQSSGSSNSLSANLLHVLTVEQSGGFLLCAPDPTEGAASWDVFRHTNYRFHSRFRSPR